MQALLRQRYKSFETNLADPFFLPARALSDMYGGGADFGGGMVGAGGGLDKRSSEDGGGAAAAATAGAGDQQQQQQSQSMWTDGAAAGMEELKLGESSKNVLRKKDLFCFSKRNRILR